MATFVRKDHDDGYDMPSAVLPIAQSDAANPADGPPADGAAYLRMVMEEARSIPDNMICQDADKLQAASHENQTSYMRQLPDIIEAPDGYAPSEAWERQFMASFEHLRDSLYDAMDPALLPDMGECAMPADQVAWRHLFENCATETSDSDALDGPCMHLAPPPWSIVRQLTTSSAAKLLREHGAWLAHSDRIYTGGGLWLFSLLGCIDDILDGSTTAALREVLRLACRQRRELADELGIGSEGNAHSEDRRLAQLNILVTITAKYFGQGAC